MQTRKSAVASAKEMAGNITTPAKAGIDKTKVVVYEKVERMRSHYPTEKAAA